KQILAGEVLRAADAGGSEGEAAALHVAHEVHEILRRHVAIDGENGWRARRDGDRRELGERIHALRGVRIDGERGRGDEQRVAVRRNGGDVLRADHAARPALRLHHHRLADALAHLLRDAARDRVGDAARRKGDGEVDRTARGRLPRSRERTYKKGKQCERAPHYSALIPFLRTTEPHFSISAFKKRSYSPGASICTSNACRASCPVNSRFAATRFSSPRNRSAISPGVRAGRS